MPSEPLLQRRLLWARILIPLGISLATLTGLGLAVDGKALLPVLRQADLPLLLLAALKAPALILLWSLRWRLILRARRFPVSLSQTTAAVLVRTFFNALTPGAGTGGEPFGAYYLSRRTPLTFKEAIASTAAERMAQGVAMVGIVLVALGICVPLLPLSSALIRSALLGLIGFTGFVGLMLYLSLFRFHYARAILQGIARTVAWAIPSLRRRWNPDEVGGHLDEFHREYRAFLKGTATFLGIALFTALHWGLDLLQPYLLFRALGAQVPFHIILMSATTVKLMGVFSILPGGSGLMEGMNFGLYAALSAVPHQVILAETLLFRALDAWTLWLGSGIVTGVVAPAFLTGVPPRADGNGDETAPVPRRNPSPRKGDAPMPRIALLLGLFLLAPLTRLEAEAKPKVHHFTLDFGSDRRILSSRIPFWALSLSYARRVRGNLLFGVGAGAAWEENTHTFDRNIWNVLHGDLFARYQPAPFVHLDLGATVLGFSPHDDDDRRGSFAGGYVSLALGYRYVFFAPCVRFGRTSDYRGSEFGVLASPLVLRFVIPW